jgi:hypothetical protein
MRNVLFAILTLSITLSCTFENGNLSGEDGKLSGIVTYKDTYESSCLADAGSEIYAINEADVRSTQYDDIANVIENFQIFKSEYTVSINNTIDPDRIKKAQDNFDITSDFTSKYITGFKQLPQIVRAKTNGAGKYTLSLRPGKYYILIVSGSVKSNNAAEFTGNVDYRIEDIRSAKETSVNVNFEKNERTWIKLILRRQLPGC